MTDKNNITPPDLNTFINFDLSELLLGKKEIVEKYDKIIAQPEATTEFLHDFINLIDRFLLHIFEEIVELIEEFGFNEKPDAKPLRERSNREEVIYELTDVYSYCCSLLYILAKTRYGDDYITEEKVIKLPISEGFIDFTVRFNADKNLYSQVHNTAMNCERFLISEIRRKFPERKWHKDTDRHLSKHEFNALLDDCITTLNRKVLFDLTILFLLMVEGDIDEMNKYLLTKHNKVMKNI